MAVLVSQLITQIDRHTGDSSLDRFSLADRYDAITEAVVSLQEGHLSEMQNFTYSLNYLDTMHYYQINNVLSDILMCSDLRRLEGENNRTFGFKDGRTLSEDISNGSQDSNYTLERHDGKSYIVINHPAKYTAITVSKFESLTDGGTWTLDGTTSDANTLTLDQVGFYEGAGCLKFNTTVAQSGNNRASIYATDLNSLDFTSIQGLSSALLELGLPDVTYFSSVTLTWGTNTSNYWSTTKTTPISGAWAIGQNTVNFSWTSTTTMTGTPDVTDINYIRIDLNYTASQANAVDYRIDNLRFARSEPLTLYYLSNNVGKDTSLAAISLFSAGTDTPFFSGQYDQLKYYVGHYAAGILLQDNRLFTEANEQFKEAATRLKEAKLLIPSSAQIEQRSFGIRGLNFNSRRIGSNFKRNNR